MSYERLWERLLEFLNGWSTATEVSPGRIEVTLADPGGSTRMVEILMTRKEWDEMASVAWGQFDAAAQQVRTMLLGLRGTTNDFWSTASTSWWPRQPQNSLSTPRMRGSRS